MYTYLDSNSDAPEMMLLTMMATAPLTAVVWKSAVTSTYLNCSIDKEGYTFYARWLLKTLKRNSN